MQVVIITRVRTMNYNIIATLNLLYKGNAVIENEASIKLYS